MLFRQINLNKSFHAQKHLCYVISQDDENCIYLIQEPYYKKKVFKGLPAGYKILGTQSSRAIILAPKHLPIFTVQEFTKSDYTIGLFDDGAKKNSCNL